MKGENYIYSLNKTELFYKYLPGEKSKTIIFTHGYGEYSDRYEDMVSFFNDKGFSIAIYDLRGHGRSTGARGHVDKFDLYIEDLNNIVLSIKKSSPKDKIVLGGHSLGGLITLKYIVKYQNNVDLSFLSSPYLRLAMRVPLIKKGGSKILSKVAPKLSMLSNIDPNILNHDQNSIQKYISDPLVHKVVTPRWFTETSKAQKKLYSEIKNITIPIFMLQGGKDKLASPKWGKRYFDRLKSENSRYEEYPDYFHEVLHEIDKAVIFEEIVKWVDSF